MNDSPVWTIVILTVAVLAALAAWLIGGAP